jgi:hypothetical protein
MKMLASKCVNGRTLYVIEGDVKKGDKVLVETRDGATQATVTSTGAFSFAVSRDGKG